MGAVSVVLFIDPWSSGHGRRSALPCPALGIPTGFCTCIVALTPQVIRRRAGKSIGATS